MTSSSHTSGFEGDRVQPSPGQGVALVTGAGSGIGDAITRRLAADGINVIAVDRTHRTQVETEDAPANRPTDGVIQRITTDLSDPAAVAALTDRVLAEHGHIRVLVNNVGISPHRSSFLAASDDDWAGTWNLNLMTAVRLIRALVPTMVDHRSGVIVNVTSALAGEPDPGMPDYCASKAALAAVTQMVSNEFARQGVRCLSVAPGPTLTEQWTAPGGQIDQYQRATGLDAATIVNDLIPRELGLRLGRIARPAEVAGVVAFAVSEAAAAMTGCTLLVDSGMTAAV